MTWSHTNCNRNMSGKSGKAITIFNNFHHLNSWGFYIGYTEINLWELTSWKSFYCHLCEVHQFFFTKCLYYYYTVIICWQFDINGRSYFQIFDGVTRLGNLYIKICNAGCSLFQEWKTFFYCNEKKKIFTRVEFGRDGKHVLLGKKVRVLLQNIFLTFAHSWKTV